MAGSISLSLSQQFDELGAPLAGGKLYFYEAGTVATPQNAYQDSGLTIAHANPIILDSAGRVPAFYLADGEIKVKLASSTGVQQFEQDNILVIGPSSGSGGGGGVDATTVFQTGDVKWRYDTASHSGWVPCNARTIGSATSGATERANADCEDLFVHLWNKDSNLSVSGGRGANAAADWAANKTITLPDGRNRAIAALGAMGGTDAARLTSTYFGASGTTLGATGGSESHTLTTAQLASHTHGAGSYAVTDNHPGFSAQSVTDGNDGSLLVATSEDSDSRSVSGTSGSAGSGSAHNNVPPTILMTMLMKL